MVLGEDLRALADRVALADMLFIHAGEADPVIGPELLRDPGGQQGLVQGGLGLDQQDIRARLMQDLHPAAVELVQDLVADPVVAAVLRTVRQISPVGPDPRQAQRPGPSGFLTFLLPPLVSCFDEDLHGPRDQLFRFFPCAAVCHEARDRRLIAAGDPAVRARPEIIQVDLFDQVRRLRQRPGCPQL